jgi:CubicO group peptidase (beta-lactamase class C family)
LAIAHKGRLVFSEGYGDADVGMKVSFPPGGLPSPFGRKFLSPFGLKFEIPKVPVTTNHLFRIASLAKPITAVAVFRLIEEGKLQLNEQVFGDSWSGVSLKFERHILGNDFGTPPPDSGIDQITVQHLLEHTSGWANEQDPMLAHFQMNQSELITWMLKQPLTTTPGSTYSYLNFGYLVLGRVIEARSSMSYADYVRQEVLAPCGISDMQIAGDTIGDRRTNEVIYYGFPKGSRDPYAIRVSRMDAHGGWIASPTDLLRFLVRVDRFVTVPDILLNSSMRTMFTTTTAKEASGDPTNYAKGWRIFEIAPTLHNYWHIGRLPGTAAAFSRTHDEFCWAVLMNSLDETSEDTAKNMVNALDALMRDILGDIKVWPQGSPL